MELNNTISYDVAKSAKRMDYILNATNSNYEDEDSVPDIESLTHSNWYYVDVSVLCIEIIGSLDMTDDDERPKMAKIYRSFISECVAIMNGETICKQINIDGNCVWGIFDTNKKSDIANLIIIASKLKSMVEILNYKLDKKGYSNINIAIGIDYGKALMIKAGYLGSGIKDVIWMGEVVDSAKYICSRAGRCYRKPIFVSYSIYCNLSDENKEIFKSHLDSMDYPVVRFYEADLENDEMYEWYRENCD